MALLTVNNLKKSFGNTQVLKGVSFSLERGQALAIIGSSGSGKTTLLRCLNFLEMPDEGNIMIGDYKFLPCTPAGVMALLERSNIDPAGKKCVVIGRSNIVGKPMAMLLLHANGTVTICHSKTKDLAAVCREADILVVAIGRADFVGADMVKPGAVVIDVGMNRRADGKLTGDVNFAEVEPIASAITPVPGGVGPMTITMLLQNTLTAAK